MDLESRLWAWCNTVLGRPYELQVWDCFQLLLAGQAEAGLQPSFEPIYRKDPNADPGRTMARNFARGFRTFKKIEAPQLGAAALFRDEGVPVHVGMWMAPNTMIHVNTKTATTLAEIGPGTDYHFSLAGFYVPA